MGASLAFQKYFRKQAVNITGSSEYLVRGHNTKERNYSAHPLPPATLTPHVSFKWDGKGSGLSLDKIVVKIYS